MPTDPQTFYDILGISQDATADEVAAARRSMLKSVHPDLATDEADRVEREQLSRTVNDICDTLLDPIARFDYDQALARARRGPDGIPGPDTGPADDDWPDHGEWQGDPDLEDTGIDGVHPLVQRLPGLERLERWLTWRIAGLALVMLFVAVYLYDTAGGRLLDRLGLHFGRFGSLAVVLVWTALLVVLCLGLLRVIGAIRDRLRPG